MIGRARTLRESGDLALIGRAVSRVRYESLEPALLAVHAGTPADLKMAFVLLRSAETFFAEDKTRDTFTEQVGDTLIATGPLHERGALEEQRRTADSAFVADTGLAAEAFTAAPEALGTITTAYRTLEAGHGVAEIIPALRLTGTQDVTWTQQQLTALPKQLTRMKLPAATNDLVALQRELKPHLDAARAELEKLAPKLSDRVAKGDTDAIRRDANRQALATEAGRERARDADDALAMLRHDPSAANELAEHYRNLEAGHPEETRPALRAAEEELGIRNALDAAYEQAQQIADIANAPDPAAPLEQALAGNPEMQQELAHIAQQTIAAAQSNLLQAATNEQQIATALSQQPAFTPQQTQQAQNAQQLAQAA